MPPRRKALEAAQAQILLHSQAHEAAQAQMLLHSQAHAAAQAQIVALQARVNALELKLEQRGSDAIASGDGPRGHPCAGVLFQLHF